VLGNIFEKADLGRRKQAHRHTQSFFEIRLFGSTLGMPPPPPIPLAGRDILNPELRERGGAVHAAPLDPATITQVLGDPAVNHSAGECARAATSGVKLVPLLPQVQGHGLLKVGDVEPVVVAAAANKLAGLEADSGCDGRVKDEVFGDTHWGLLPEGDSQQSDRNR